MLTNFISEAANEILSPVVPSIQTPAAALEITDSPSIVRNFKSAEAADIHEELYGRARDIYFRARRPYPSRAANIL